MSKAKTRRTRKHRRASKARMKHGRNARAVHKGKSGRTGGMHHKKLKARLFAAEMAR